jgi:hypothetical protein
VYQVLQASKVPKEIQAHKVLKVYKVLQAFQGPQVTTPGQLQVPKAHQAHPANPVNLVYLETPAKVDNPAHLELLD